MNALVSYTNSLDLGAAPPPSKGLATAIYYATRGPRPVAGRVQREAAERLALLMEVLRPATPAEIEAWLIRFLPLHGSPKAEADFDTALPLFVAALAGVPAAVMASKATLRRAARSFKFWPSPAEAWALFADLVDDLSHERRMLLLTIANSPLLEPPEPPMSAAERAQMSRNLLRLAARIENRFRSEPGA